MSKKLQQQLTSIQQQVNSGNISLVSELDAIKSIIREINPKKAKLNIKHFFNLINVTYSERRQIYFSGKQNRKGSGKPVKLQAMPKIIIKARKYISNLSNN